MTEPKRYEMQRTIGDGYTPDCEMAESPDGQYVLYTAYQESERQLAICTQNYENTHRSLMDKIAWDRDGYWRWQGDETDHLESLTCHIVISPQQLKELLAESERKREAAEKEAKLYKSYIKNLASLKGE